MKGFLNYFILILMILVSWAFSARAWAVEAPVPLVAVQRVSLDYSNASLAAVLKSLAYSYDLNMVISKDVTGKVSAQLKNISIDDALDAILGVNGLGFSRKENIVYILSQDELELTTKAIQLGFLLAKDSKGLFAKGLSKRGDMQVSEENNSLLVTDYPQNLLKVEQMIRDIDHPPLQVLIEAQLVDIQLTDDANIGASILSELTNRINSGVAGINANVGSALTNLVNTDNKAVFTATQTNAAGGLFSAGGVWKNVTAGVTINALVTKKKARVLASPSIATLSGKEAMINIGKRIPYTAATAVTGSTSTTSTAFADVGTSLRVTPIISNDGWITMKLHPEVSALIGTPTSAGPQIDTREADTVVRVRDNETIVIGGLISKSDGSNKDSVPGLSALPLVGWLFQQRSANRFSSELTVFITPHIIYPPKPVSADKVKEVAAIPRLRVEQKDVEQDAGMLSGLLSYADTLEKDAAKSTSDDLYFNLELIKTYKMILHQFPQSGKGDFCLYKIVSIYVKGFAKCDAAREAFAQLKETFPDSPYVDMAQPLVVSCQDAPAGKNGTAASGKIR